MRLQKLPTKYRLELNPHPAGQMTLNVPKIDDEPVPGVQHKYRETVLIFPSAGKPATLIALFVSDGHNL